MCILLGKMINLSEIPNKYTNRFVYLHGTT